MKILPEYGDSNDPRIRAKYGYLQALISILGNFLLFFIKLTLALLVNSIGLAADAVHSLSDISTSGIIIFGFKIAKKQPDRKHPFGHGRIEHIATVIIAVILIIIGFNFIQHSFTRILNPEPLANPEFAVITTIIISSTILGKELMARFSSLISKKIKSDMLKADAWHHRTDAISSVGVVIGIIGSYLGFPILDAIFGLVVSLIIIYVGFHLIKSSSDYLLGTRPKKEFIEQLQQITQNIVQVTNIHSIYVHDYGHIKIVTFHVEMDGELTLNQAHAIADKIEHTIMKKTQYLPVVHVEPSGIHNKTMNNTRK